MTELEENPINYTRIMSSVEASVLLSADQVIAKESSDEAAAAIQNIISRSRGTIQELDRSFSTISIHTKAKQLHIANLGDLHLVTLARRGVDELLLDTLLNLAARDILKGRGVIGPTLAGRAVWYEIEVARLTGLMKGDVELHEAWKNRWLELPQSKGAIPRRVTIKTAKGRTAERELKFTRVRSENIAMLSARILKELDIKEGDKVQISPVLG